MTNPIDTIAAATTLRVMIQLDQMAGFVHGVEMALANPGVAAECLRHLEDLMNPDDLAKHRVSRDDIRDAVAELRRVLS